MQRKVVLITGGSSGIGKATGNFLKTKGYIVYGTTRNLANYSNFDAFELLELDVRNDETIRKAVAELITREGRLDVLINNAGVGITGAIEETPNEEISNVFDINFQGPLRMIKEVLPQMRKQKEGLIINITSIAGYMGLPYRGIYSATKGALELATEALRMETNDFGVKITNVAPGDYATNIASGRYHVEANKNSPYFEKYNATLNDINSSVDLGGNPIQVSEMVYKIIKTKNPSVSYRVGAPMQKFSIFLKKILPQKMFEKLLMKHYKL